jgi:NADH-quinone oxidoreductase subunit H
VTFVEVLLTVIKSLVFLMFVLNLLPIAIWADRRQSAMVQDRVGPNRAVIWVSSTVARALLLGPPALLACAAAYFAFVPVRGQLAYDRMVVSLELAILVSWLFLLVLAGQIRKYGAINGFERWLTSFDPRTIFYVGLVAHVVTLVLSSSIGPANATLGARMFGVVLAIVFVLTGAYGASRIADGKVGLRLFGTIHSLADVIKLIFKEDFVPKNADKLLHAIAPIIALFPPFVILAVIPFGNTLCFQDGGTPGWDFSDLGRLAPVVGASGTCGAGQLPVALQIADLNVGILFIFAMAGTGVIGAALAGWASDNQFALLGGLRAASQMVSYEVALGLSVCGLFMIYGSVRLLPMVEWQGLYAWGIFVQPIAFLLFITALNAESKRLPFDQPEGESEIVAGYFLEYSGMKFGMFFMGEYMELVTSSALLVALFFGGYQLPFLHPDGITVAFGDSTIFTYKMTHLAVSVLSVLVFFGKTIFIGFVQIFFRWTLPRFRYDQVMKLGWTMMLPIALGNILVTGLVVLAIQSAGPEVTSVLRVLADATQALVALGMLGGAIAFVAFLLQPASHKTFLRSTSARFSAAAGGVKATPQQA